MSIHPIRAATLALLLAGCGESGDLAAPRTIQMEPMPAMATAPIELPAAPPPPDLPAQAEPSRLAGALDAAGPRIAYTYGYTFRLPAAAVAAVQERHLQLCYRLGPLRCRVTSLRRGGAGPDGAAASLALEVAAPLAARFGGELVAASAAAGAETVDRSIRAEDLSRQMIDSAARIRTRETLIRRLTALLETRSGNIQQAVEAERAINSAQEELEAARAWLAQMRTRVAMSTVEIGYHSPAPAAVAGEDPLAAALAQAGPMAKGSLAAMVLVAGAVLPWLLLALPVVLIVRRRRRNAWDGSEPGPDPAPDPSPA